MGAPNHLKAASDGRLTLNCRRPDNLPGDLRTQAVEMEEVNETFQDWDPRLQRLLSTSQSVISFKLLHFPELEVWSKVRVRHFACGYFQV